MPVNAATSEWSPNATDTEMTMSMPKHWSAAQKAEYLMAKSLSLLPVGLTSDIGGYLGKKQAAKSINAKRLWVDRLRNNLQHLCGIEDAQEREQHLIDFVSRIGRIYAEYMVLQKIVQKGRLEIIGQEILDNLDKQVIIVSCHLSNWELVGHIGASLQRPGSDLYLGLDNPVREQLALEARSGWSMSHRHIPASPYSLRPITKALNEGRNFLIFIDEMRDEYVSAPSLGREIEYAGNRWFAARLAVKHGLDILPTYILPKGKGRYQAVVEPLIQPDKFQGSDDDKAKAIADQLDGILNRCISENLEHWYWLPYYDQHKVVAAKE